MDIPKKLKPFVNDYKINLAEVAFLDDQLDNFHSDFRIIAEYFINKRKNIDYVASTQEIRHVDEFLKLMQAREGDDRYEEVLHTLQNEDVSGRSETFGLFNLSSFSLNWFHILYALHSLPAFLSMIFTNCIADGYLHMSAL